MSLDVYIILPKQEHGEWQTKRERSLEEAGEMKGLIPLIEQYYADREPERTEEVYWANITHNLAGMADAAGIYEPVWCPAEFGIKKAGDLIEPLTVGLAELKSKPDHYKQFNPKNGWGNYEGFVDWVERYLTACKENPEGKISVSR